MVDDEFWLCRLLVENPFEDYYVGLHLQNDLCYGYCWDCFEIYFWMMFLRCCFDFFVEWWVGRFVLRCCFEILVEWCFWMMVFMRLLWNDGESVGGVQGYVMIGRWARPTLTVWSSHCQVLKKLQLPELRSQSQSASSLRNQRLPHWSLSHGENMKSMFLQDVQRA